MTGRVPRHEWIIAIVIVAVTLVGAGGVWWWFSTTTVLESSPVETAAPDEGSADAVVRALESLETDPASLLPPELQEEFGPRIEEAVPPGTRVDADATSWTPSSAGGGVIEADVTYPDGEVARLALVMAREGEAWTVLQTVPVSAE